MLKPFANSTLIEITLKKINKITLFDDVIFAVYDQELIDIADKYKNVKILKRDEDEVQKGIVDLKTRFKYFNKIETDYIFLLNPCCPLTSTKTIINAYNYFQNTDYNTYTSVIKSRDWIFDSNSNSITRKDSSNVATNKGDWFYKATHMFHILNKKFFVDNGIIWTFGENDPRCIEVPKDEYYDVDDDDDFHITQYAYIRSFKDD